MAPATVDDRRRTIGVAMHALAALFGQTLTAELLGLYCAALSDLSTADIEAACQRCVRECRFFPKPVEIRERAGMSLDERVLLAWESLAKTARMVGCYQSVVFDDPVLCAAVDNLGGWVRMCEIPESEFNTHFRRNFERVYKTLLVSGRCTRSIPLIGLFEQDNRLRGQPVAPPQLVTTGITGLPALPKPEPARLRIAAECDAIGRMPT